MKSLRLIYRLGLVTLGLFITFMIIVLIGAMASIATFAISVLWR